MMIGSTDNHSGNFIQPDWLKKGQQDESGLVSKAVKPESLTQKAVEELTKKLGQEPDKKEENAFAAAYGVEISDEGYAALAQQMNAGQVEESTVQPVIAEQVESAKDEPMVYSKKLEHSGWVVPKYSGPEGFIDNIADDITQIFSNTDPKDKAIAEDGFFWLAEDLNAYLELSGGTDASGFLGELSDKLQNMKGSHANPLLDRVISMVEEARSGHYIDNKSDDFHDKNSSAIDAYNHMVKSGQLDDRSIKSGIAKMFNPQAIQNMMDRFATKQTGELLDAMLGDNPEENRPTHPLLTDVLNASQDKTTDGHEDMAQKLRELE